MEDPSLQEVEDIIQHLKNFKAPGVDSISNELIKYGGIEGEMHKLIQEIWKEEYMPEEWNISLIVPIHKKGNKLDCRNYRGISMLCTGYKIFTRILQKKLEPYVEGTLGDYQGGF